LQAEDTGLDPEGTSHAIFSHHYSLLMILYKLFGGSEDAFVREISFVDPRSQTATITSVNLSLSQVATCLERIQYTPARNGRTYFAQSAAIEARIHMWRTAADKLENWLADRFAQNAQLGKMAFMDVLSSMWESKEQHAMA
jgi:PRELI-like family